MNAHADAPVSPELVLVASPEEAELARRSLPLPVPPIPRFPTFPPAQVRARAARAERSWTYGVAAAVLVALAVAAGIVLNRSGDEPATPGRPTVTQPTATQAPTPTQERTTSAPGNTTSTPTKTTTSSAPKGFVPSRVFAWPERQGAVAYVIRFFNGSKLVFERRTVEPRITLPETFEFAPGHYRWLVVPVDADGDEGSAVVASAFDVGA